MSSTKTKVSAPDVIKAIKGTAGVKTTISKKLGVTRRTFDNYLARWSTVLEAYNEEKAGVDDMALSVVINDIVNNKDVSTAKWWLTKKVDGFGDRVQVDWHKAIENEGVPPEVAAAIFEADVEAMLGIMTGDNADKDV